VARERERLALAALAAALTGSATAPRVEFERGLRRRLIDAVTRQGMVRYLSCRR
jgi:hypothetical protein